MQFLVLSRREIKNYKCDKPHIIISIKDPNSSDIEIAERKNCLGILRLSFHDFEDEHLDYPDRIKLISKEDAKNILEFVAYSKKIDIIICQCEAGISRSAGVAGALSKIINGDDKVIFHQYLPNMLVYRTIIKETYKQRRALIKLLNNYDCLIEEYRNPLKTIIEEALAKVDNMEVKNHHNLLGNKNKYIKAILEALKDE